MNFESEDQLKEFVLDKGCFDETENLRIYRKFFAGSMNRIRRLSSFFNFEGAEVLDVGCSYGQFIIHFPQGSAGVEIHPRMMEFARSLGLEVVSANIEDHIPFDNLSFDVIHCNAVLEHMVSPHKLLLEFHRILKSQGKLIIGVPNMDVIGYKGWKASEHLYAYNKKSLLFLLERSGFKVIKIWRRSLGLKVITPLIPEKIELKFTSNLKVVAEQIPNFTYPEKRLEIFTPSWMKKD